MLLKIKWLDTIANEKVLDSIRKNREKFGEELAKKAEMMRRDILEGKSRL